MDKSILFDKLVENINVLLRQYNEETGVVITGEIGEKYPIGECYFPKGGKYKDIIAYPKSKYSGVTSILIDDNKLYTLKPHINMTKCSEINNDLIEIKTDIEELQAKNKTELEIDKIILEKYKDFHSTIQLAKYANRYFELFDEYYNKLIEKNKGSNIFKYRDFCEIIKSEEFLDLHFNVETNEIYYANKPHGRCSYTSEYILQLEMMTI